MDPIVFITLCFRYLTATVYVFLHVGVLVIRHLLKVLKQNLDSPNHEHSTLHINDAQAALTQLASDDTNKVKEGAP